MRQFLRALWIPVLVPVLAVLFMFEAHIGFGDIGNNPITRDIMLWGVLLPYVLMVLLSYRMLRIYDLYGIRRMRPAAQLLRRHTQLFCGILIICYIIAWMNSWVHQGPPLSANDQAAWGGIVLLGLLNMAFFYSRIAYYLDAYNWQRDVSQLNS